MRIRTAFLIILFSYSSLSKAQPEVIKDSAFINYFILKLSPLTFAEIPHTVTISAEIKTAGSSTINFQLGYIYFDPRNTTDFGADYNYVGKSSIKLDQTRPNFKLKVEYKFNYETFLKKSHQIVKYISSRLDYNLVNYTGQYNICSHFTPSYGFLGGGICDSETTIHYKQQVQKYGIDVIWGKQIIYKSHFILEYYFGLGVLVKYNKVPPIEKGYDYDYFLGNFTLFDFGPASYIQRTEYLIYPNIAAGFRIGYSF